MPLSWIYGKIADARNRLYDSGIFETFDLGARTISIGNITTGGTGKTPLVAYVANILAARGEKVCILTRGYGRENAKKRVLVSDGEKILAEVDDAGDEPYELAKKLLSKAIVIADADRVSSAEWAKRKFGVTAFVLDDGFQHRKAKRDVDIVCIDATDPFGGGKMLPSGRLREPLHNLKRPDIVVITKTNLVDRTEALKSEISNLNEPAAIFEAKTEVIRVVALKGKKSADLTRKAVAFCGIGNSESFFEQLRQRDLTIAATKPFRDHHDYTQTDIDKLEKLAQQNGAEILLTTAKDAVKLSNLRFRMDCFVVEIEMRIDDANGFAKLL